MGLLIIALTAIGLVACGGGSKDDGPARTGTDQEQIQSLVGELMTQTSALDADAAWATFCKSWQDKNDLKVIRDNMAGFKNVGGAAPQISNLAFSSVTAEGDAGEARYSYTQVFRGQTTTIQEGVKVSREEGDWCIKDQIEVPQ